MMSLIKRDPWSALPRALAVLVLLLAFASAIPTPHGSAAVGALPDQARGSRRLSHEDELLLEDIEPRSWRYFLDERDPQTGLGSDPARIDGTQPAWKPPNVGSIAATGFC